ncbi:DUF6447 family protein [bacterium]|nr:DUF6447 family protein [bacterium]
MSKITIDGNEYETDELGPKVLEQLQNVRFVDEMILQKNNEIQVAQTAQIGYSRALKRELEKIDE